MLNRIRTLLSAFIVIALMAGAASPAAAQLEPAAGKPSIRIKECPEPTDSFEECALIDEPAFMLTPGARTNWQQQNFVCVGDGRSGNRVHVVVAELQNRSLSRGEVEKIVHGVDGIFDMSASWHGGRRVVRWEGENCGKPGARVKIGKVTLPDNWHRQDDLPRLFAIGSALQQAGYDTNAETLGHKYLVLVDVSQVDWDAWFCGMAYGPVEDPSAYSYAYAVVGAEYCRDYIRTAAHELAHTLGVDHVAAVNDLMGDEIFCYTIEECANHQGAVCPHPIFRRIADCKGNLYFNPNKGEYFDRKGWKLNIAASPFLADPGGKPLPKLIGQVDKLAVNYWDGGMSVEVEASAVGASGKNITPAITVSGPSDFRKEEDGAFRTYAPKPGEHTVSITWKDGSNTVTWTKKFTVTAPGGGGGGTGRFRDVADGNVFRGDIEKLAAAGITRGCNPPRNDLYCPKQSVTRGQMAGFLVRALGLPKGTARFSDTNGHVFEGDVAALAAADITRGCNPPRNDRFCPDQPVTRGQMAAFLVRALGLPKGNARFADTKGSVFEGDIAALAAAGITRGCNPPRNDRFCPDEPVTREQMAAFLVRAGLAG